MPYFKSNSRHFLSLDRLSLVPGQLVCEESYRYDSNGLRFLPGDGIEMNLELYIVLFNQNYNKIYKNIYFGINKQTIL